MLARFLDSDYAIFFTKGRLRATHLGSAKVGYRKL